MSHDFVFAAGDCAAIEGHSRPKAGVWAVRAGPPLAANLRRAAKGERLRAWRPPEGRAARFMGLGDGSALAWRSGLAVAGKPIWHWKDYIDRRWMRKMPRADGGDAGLPVTLMRCGSAAAPRSAPRS